MLFEKGKRYLMIYSSKELGRGDQRNVRITDREDSHNRPKLTGFQVDLVDVDAATNPLLKGKYDMIVFSQHGSDTSASGFANDAVAAQFMDLAPSFKQFLAPGGEVAWDHCYGRASGDSLNSMKFAFGVDGVWVSSGYMTGYGVYTGPIVDEGHPWIRK